MNQPAPGKTKQKKNNRHERHQSSKYLKDNKKFQACLKDEPL